MKNYKNYKHFVEDTAKEFGRNMVMTINDTAKEVGGFGIEYKYIIYQEFGGRRNYIDVLPPFVALTSENSNPDSILDNRVQLKKKDIIKMLECARKQLKK